MTARNVKVTGLVSEDDMEGDSPEDSQLLRGMLAEARSFLSTRTWCLRIVKGYFGLGVGGVLAVFLFEIEPDQDADRFIWVVVGDVPTAYLAADAGGTPCEALESYVHEMERWIEAVRTGRSVNTLIPVGVEATLQNAEELESRLEFIKGHFLGP